jgi:hypothetical protein
VKSLPLGATVKTSGATAKTSAKASEAHLVTVGTLYVNGNKPVTVKDLFEAVLIHPCVGDRLNPWQYWRGVLYGKAGKQLFKVENHLVTLPEKVYRKTSVA